MTTITTGPEIVDRASGLPRWDLPDGRYVIADSGINGGGLCIMEPCPPFGYVAAVRGKWAADIIGEDHPAVLYSREMTAEADRAQRAAGRELAQIMSDGRRYR